MENLEEKPGLLRERVAHAVKYLHRHRDEFVKGFTEFYGNYECDQLVERSMDCLTRVGEEILRMDPVDWTFDFLQSFAVNLDNIDALGKTVVYLMIFETKVPGLAVYARSTRDTETRFVMHIASYRNAALGLDGVRRYVYDRALEVSDEPPFFLVIARDPDDDAEQCFVEHLESLVISMMDLCHTKDSKSLQLTRGAQHSSLLSSRDHDKLEGLNRMIPVKQSATRAKGYVECRNCNADIETKHYRAHLDDEGDLRSLHIYQLCGAGLSRPGDLTKHIKTHNLERPFVCETCGKDFRTTDILNQHSRVHDEDRGNVCDTCGEFILVHGHFSLHLRTHEPDYEPIRCETCGRTFITQSRLESHRLVHSDDRPYKCSYPDCTKSFKHMGDLTRHERTHGGKEFKCPVEGCPFSSTDKGNFKQHVARHSDERPFVCDIVNCKSTAWKNKGDLYKHRKLHQTCPHCNEVITSVRQKDVNKHLHLCSTRSGFIAGFEKRQAARDLREREAVKAPKLDNDNEE